MSYARTNENMELKKTVPRSNRQTVPPTTEKPKATGLRHEARSHGPACNAQRKHAGNAALRGPVATIVLLTVGLVMSGACRRAAPNQPPESQEAPKPDAPSSIVFPDELHAKDDTANAFVEQAMNTCLSGDYDEFRLLWSTRSDPMPRDEFEQGWQAVQQIRLVALERIILLPKPDDETEEPEGGTGATRPSTEPDDDAGGPRERVVYAFYAELELDPNTRAGQLEAVRPVIAMLVKEHGQWRLTSAPKSVRKWMREKIAEGASSDEPSTDEDTVARDRHD